MRATKKIRTIKIVEVVSEPKMITTVLDGEVETTREADIGDIVVTGTKGEHYVMDRISFDKRYIISDDNTSATTKPVEIEFYYCSTPDYTFTASWGEKMTAQVGSAMVMENGELSYSIDPEVFKNTYDVQ